MIVLLIIFGIIVFFKSSDMTTMIGEYIDEIKLNSSSSEVRTNSGYYNQIEEEEEQAKPEYSEKLKQNVGKKAMNKNEQFSRNAIENTAENTKFAAESTESSGGSIFWGIIEVVQFILEIIF